MKRGKRGSGRKSSPKQTLNPPDLDRAELAVLNSLPSKNSQRGYRRAIEGFVAWYCSEPRLSFHKAVVTRYRIHLESRQLAPGTINGRLRGLGKARTLAPIAWHRMFVGCAGLAMALTLGFGFWSTGSPSSVRVLNEDSRRVRISTSGHCTSRQTVNLGL